MFVHERRMASGDKDDSDKYNDGNGNDGNSSRSSSSSSRSGDIAVAMLPLHRVTERTIDGAWVGHVLFGTTNTATVVSMIATVSGCG